MKTINIIIGIFLFSLFGCFSPKPVVKLLPKTTGKKEFWNRGINFVGDENNQIAYECGFLRQENNKLVYNLRITNFSNRDILVAPEKFKQTVYSNDTTKIGTNMADDPEMVLFNMQMDASNSEADAKNAMVVGAVATVATGAALVAISSSNSNNNEAKTDAADAAIATNNVMVASTFSNAEESNINVESSISEYERLSNSYLRKTTLSPNTYIDGEVRFTYNPLAKWYCLNLSVENSAVDFYFWQILYDPAQFRVKK